MTALGVLCCFALFVCLTLLAFSSFSSLIKNMYTLYITEPVCYVICCNFPATVRPLPAIWHGRVCTADGRGLVPGSRVWDGTAPRGPASPQSTVSQWQRRMWGEYIHTRVERFARSRVGFWHAAILRVIPPVRVKSLGFACVYAKARRDGITRDLACI